MARLWRNQLPSEDAWCGPADSWGLVLGCAQVFNHNYADVCPHSLWNFVNIIEYCPSLLVLGKYTSFLDQMLFDAMFYPHCWFISCFLNQQFLVALPTIQGFSPGAIGLDGVISTFHYQAIAAGPWRNCSWLDGIHGIHLSVEWILMHSSPLAAV